MLTSQTFKDLLHKEIGSTLRLTAVQSVSKSGGGTLSLSIYASGRIDMVFNPLRGGYRQHRFESYEELKQRSSCLGFFEEMVLTTLKACETVELKAAKGGGFAVPVAYSITFKILQDDRVSWEVR